MPATNTIRTFAALLATILFVGIFDSPAAPLNTGAPVPDWVALIPPDLGQDLPADEAENGIHYLAFDQQVNLRDGYQISVHHAWRFANSAGVQDHSEVAITFDPSYQTLGIHSLNVYRDGGVQDRLHPDSFRLISTETGHERSLYDGRLTAIAILEDIRPDDVLEYRYTLAGANPVFGGRAYELFETAFDVPVQRVGFRILVPDDRPLTVKNHGTDLAFSRTGTGGTDDYRWEILGAEAAEYEDSVPDWIDEIGWVEISEYSSWQSVARWASQVYELGGFPPPPLPREFAEQVGLICRDHPAPPERAIAALRYVQDSVRYVGMFDGVHTHQPHSIEEIARRRFGDCKDKTRLLVAMLTALGLDAVPALVNTEATTAIGGWLPSPLAFDHVITRLHLDGTSYWLDPTNSDQGGDLAHLAVPRYGLALLVQPTADGVTPIETRGTDISHTDMSEIYAVGDYSGAATLSIATTYSGPVADSIRSWFNSESRSTIEEEYLDYFSDRETIRSAAPLTVEDDVTTNRYTVEETYELDDFWVPSDDGDDTLEAYLYSHTLAGYLSTPDRGTRRLPFAISAFPETLDHEIVLTTPNEIRVPAESHSIEDDGFRYRYQVSSRGNTLRVHHHLETLADHVAAEDVRRFAKRVDEIDDWVTFWLWVPDAWQSGAYPAHFDTGDSVAWMMSGFVFAWPVAGCICVGFAFGVAVAGVLFMWDPPPWRGHQASSGSLPRPPPGGWLIPMAVVLIGQVIALLTLLPTLPFSYEAGSAADRGEAAIVAALVPGIILAIALFFGRRSSFPPVATALFAIGIVFPLWLVAREISEEHSSGVQAVVTILVSTGIVLTSAAGLVYLVSARRVRRTFYRRYGRLPVPPPVEA